MLFDITNYFEYKFPEPQYLGAKFVHRGWIARYIPENVETVLDAFSGSQSVSYMFKQLGKRVITNDFLKFNSLIGKALVENRNDVLNEEDVRILFEDSADPKQYDLIQKLFTGLFFNSEDSCFADSFRSNVGRLENPYKQALALSVMCRSMTRKVTMEHFAHTKALEYASDPARVKRNKSLAQPLKSLFLELLPKYNGAIFDNNKKTRVTVKIY